MTPRPILRRVAPLVALAALVSCGGAEPMSADRYAHRVLRIIVPFSPGGTYDLHARVMAGHLGRHLPGHPEVVVEQMVGAGGLIAARHLLHRAPRDGGTMGMLSPAVSLSRFYGGDDGFGGVHRWGIVGSPHVDVPVCIFATAVGIGNIADWRHARSPPRIGMTGPGALSHAFAMIVTEALELPMTPVSGYQGMFEIRHALDGNEIDGACLGSSAYSAIFGSSSDYVVGLDAARDRDPRAVAELLMTISTVGRYYAFPPGTPADRVEIVSEAFEATMMDPEFLRAAASARLNINWRTAREVTQGAAALERLSPDRERLLADALSPTRSFDRSR